MRTSIIELYEKYGIGAKFVRAYCRAQGWRYDAQGAPTDWYKAWRGPLGREIARLVSSGTEVH